MSNKNFYENELIIEERSHSYEYYKSRIRDTYNEEFAKIKKASETKAASYNFTSVFNRVTNANDSVGRNYNSNRIMLFKNLNLLNSFTTIICDNNIDSSILSNGFSVQTAGHAFIWFMCDAYGYKDKDAQDLNRIRAYKKLIYELEKMDSVSFFDNAELDAFSQRNEREKIMEKDFDAYKQNLKEILRKTFSVYDELSKYSSYLPDYFVSDDSLNTDDKTGTKNTEQIEDSGSIFMAYILSETIKKVFIELLSGFSKIPNLNLGNSNFDYACFSRSNLSGSNFINSTFVRAQMDNAILSDCDFSICDFSHANAKEATLNNCTFNYSDMKGLNLTNAVLNNSNFDSVLFRDIRIDGNKSFAKEVISNLSNNADKEKAEMLADELNTVEMDLDKTFSNLYLRLGKDEKSSEDSLWYLTAVESEAEENASDYEIKIGCYEQDDEGNFVIKGTHFDKVFNKISDLLNSVNASCAGKVIGGELLDYMYQAEKDNYKYVKNIEDENENICLEKSVLTGATIKDSSLHQVDLSNINFENASFESSDLSECVAYYSLGKTASFTDAVVGAGEFFSCNLDDTSFAGANCIGTKFINCSMNNLNMEKAIAIGARFINTVRSRPFIEDILLFVDDIREDINDQYEFSQEENNLVESNWSNAALSKAMFIGYLMDRSHFRNTDIRSSLFFDCVLRWSVFNDCDASYALLLGNCFHQANFTNANLSQSHIFSSEFSGCQMVNANFIGARCDRTIFFDDDLTNANFSHCLFQNCIFRDCEFNNVNMSNVDFNRCVFINVSFENCKGMIQNSAVFTDCMFPDNPNREKEEAAHNLGIGGGFAKRSTKTYLPIKKASEANGSNPFKLIETKKNPTNNAYDLFSTSWK